MQDKDTAKTMDEPSSSSSSSGTIQTTKVAFGVAFVCVLVGTPKGRSVLRRSVSTLASGVGFVVNSVWELVPHAGRSKKQSQWDTALTSLKTFLEESGVGDELTKRVSHRLLGNLGLLAKVQETSFPLAYRSREMQIADKSILKQLPTMEEAARTMRFATAVYGYSMIQSVEVALRPEIMPYATLEEEILRHTKIAKAEDVLVADMDNQDVEAGLESLRHMVAVDHANKAVVFSVRGTLDISGVVVDLVAYTEPFCGGDAHAGMAKMARTVWNKASEALGDKIKSVPQDYELIITGHSLGAGVACLMTIMAHHDKLLPSHLKVRCLAFAPPPVFYPLEAAKEALPHITAFVHDHDVVPSLSVSAFRRVFAEVAVFDEECRHEPFYNIMRMNWGWKEMPPHIVNAVLETHNKPEETLPKVKGAPMLAIPAHVIVWLKAKEEVVQEKGQEQRRSMPEKLRSSFMEDQEESFDVIYCDPLKFTKAGIHLHSDMISDHFPAGYQVALESIVAQEETNENKKDQ